MSINLSGIFVYPVKALRGVAVTESVVKRRGLADDRRWVIVGPDGQFISQRSHPALACVGADIREGGLTLTAAGHPAFELATPVSGQRLQVRIWQDQVSAAATDPAADRWISDVLGISCRLAYMDPDCRRAITSENARPNEQVSFADGYPCLIVSEASLADLNERLAAPLPMNRFRPNLVVSGCDSFAEDDWTHLSIGEARFRATGPCARCAVTTVDQATGQSLAPEPLRTLATYRQGENGVLFGVNLIVEQPGRIRLGDHVRVARNFE